MSFGKGKLEVKKGTGDNYEHPDGVWLSSLNKNSDEFRIFITIVIFRKKNRFFSSFFFVLSSSSLSFGLFIRENLKSFLYSTGLYIFGPNLLCNNRLHGYI